VRKTKLFLRLLPLARPPMVADDGGGTGPPSWCGAWRSPPLITIRSPALVGRPSGGSCFFGGGDRWTWWRDSGYAYRVPEHFALRMRGPLGAGLVHGPAPERPGQPRAPHGGGDLFSTVPSTAPAHPEGAVFSIETAFRVKQARRRRKLHGRPAQPSFSATSSARRALATPTDITASPAPAVPGQAALPGTGGFHGTLLLPTPRSSPLLRTCHRAVSKRRSPSPPSVNAKTAQRPRLPPLPPTGAPMRGAARWSGPNSRIKGPPPTTDVCPRAGAVSWGSSR
jgi:hypothetical protein